MSLNTAFIVAAALLLSGCAGSSNAKERPARVARCAEATVDFNPASVASVQAAAAQTATGDAQTLLLALGKDRRESLKRLLARKLDPNVCVLGMPLLSISAVSGDQEEVLLLMDGGARADQLRSADGATPLLHALAAARFDVAKLLLSRGADARSATDAGTTSLHELALATIRKGSAEQAQQLLIAQDLILRGVPLQSQSGANRTTPLMMAAVAGNYELVALLLDKGADPNMKNTRGDTASGMARKRKFDDIAQLIERATASKPTR